MTDEQRIQAMKKALQDIAAMTDPDSDEENYRADDREGCLDAVYQTAIDALVKE